MHYKQPSAPFTSSGWFSGINLDLFSFVSTFCGNSQTFVPIKDKTVPGARHEGV
jgi:hypothetical protein